MTRDDTVDMFAACALQGILANSGPTFQTLGLDQVVELAADYAETLAKRLDNPSQAGV
jgi:hypothetical protein